MFDLNTKILVVDDMPTMRKIVIRCLKGYGYSDIVDSPDGDQAWDQIISAKQPFGLIISDWTMPNLPGIELLKRVRFDVRYKATPFILLTAESEGAQVQEALKAHVDGYIIKPFNADTLKAKIADVHKKISAKAG